MSRYGDVAILNSYFSKKRGQGHDVDFDLGEVMTLTLTLSGYYFLATDAASMIKCRDIAILTVFFRK